MTDVDFFLQEKNDRPPATLTPIDWLTKVFVPVFAIVAAVFVGLNGKQPRVLWGFIAVAVISQVHSNGFGTPYNDGWRGSKTAVRRVATSAYFKSRSLNLDSSLAERQTHSTTSLTACAPVTQ